MKKMKLMMIISAALILVGAIMCASVMTAYGWDFKKLTTVRYEENIYFFDKAENVTISSYASDIAILPSTDEKIKVVTYLPINKYRSVTLTEENLVIASNDGFTRKDIFEIYIISPKITVYLPEGEYGNLSIETLTSDIRVSESLVFANITINVSTGNVKCYSSATESLKIKTSTGDVFVKNISAGNVDITASTGDIKLKDVACAGDIKAKASTGDVEMKNVACKNFSSNTGTGDCELDNVIASGKFNISTDTGEVEFDRCDAGEIYVKTDTGDVKGSLLSDKVFIARTDTGGIDVPKTAGGGRCEIVTDTGDIKITIAS